MRQFSSKCASWEPPYLSPHLTLVRHIIQQFELSCHDFGFWATRFPPTIQNTDIQQRNYKFIHDFFFFFISFYPSLFIFSTWLAVDQENPNRTFKQGNCITQHKQHYGIEWFLRILAKQVFGVLAKCQSIAFDSQPNAA